MPELDLDNNEFQQALQLLSYTNRSVFLTGKAGTGKSTFLRYICQTTKKKYVVLAPTGIAAVNVGGQTIHSFFRLPFKPVVPNDPEFSIKRIRKRLRYPNWLIKLIRELELLIIDEISMVRPDIIDFIDKVLRIYSGNMRQPFGGKQLLFVGDIFQLEPVITHETRDILGRFYRDNFFFNAYAFNETTLIPIELRKVYRQNDSEFVEILDRVRVGRLTGDDLAKINSRIKPDNETDISEDDSELTMTIAGRRDTVDAINNRHMDALKTTEEIYHGTISGTFPMDSLPTDQELLLKEGAQVVFIKNDIERRWVNGTLGRVESCQDDYVMVRTEDDELHRVDPCIWSNVRYEYDEEKKSVKEIELGNFTQLPLKAAWALTIHKSQGLTFGRINIDMGSGAFAGGQTYVALSRCRSLEGITLSTPIQYKDAFVKPSVITFSRNFNNNTLIQRAISESRADMLYARAAMLFDQGDTTAAADALTEALSLRNEAGRADVARLIRLKARKFIHQAEQIETLKAENARLRTVLAEEADKYIQLARMCSGLGNNAEIYDCEAAIRNYDNALRLIPDYYPAMIGKTRMLLEMGHIDDALTTITKCRDAHRREAEPNMLIGDILSASDPIGALNAYLTADALSPKDDAGILRRIIDIYKSLDSMDLADSYIERLEDLHEDE